MHTIRLGLEWFLNPDHLPLLIGIDKGWFADAGLDVRLVEPEAHFDAFDALEAGTLDLAITEPIHLIEDVARGRSLEGFARFLHTNGGVMYLTESGIRRPRDMAGKRVQYPGAPGPGGLAIVRAMIEADGGEAGELVPVNRGFAHTDSLIEGDADVATLAFFNFEVVEARHRGHDAGFFALKDWGVPDFCQLILVGRRDHLDDHADELRGFVRVLRRGQDFIHQQPEEARALYFRRTEQDPGDPLMSAIFAATVPCFTFDLSLSAHGIARLGTWMRDAGLIERAPEFGSCWRDDLI